MGATVMVPPTTELVGATSVNKAYSNGWTAMHHAASNNDVPALKKLLECGGIISMVCDGVTPLDVAKQFHQEGAMKCIRQWIVMSVTDIRVIQKYGWKYYELPRWTPRKHKEFPNHLRTEVCAVAVSIAELAPVLHLLAKVLDALKRNHPL